MALFSRIRLSILLIAVSSGLFSQAEVSAGVVTNASDLGGGSRWDAAPRSFAGIGERSLDGGLRYSVEGGSLANFRDLFTWSLIPTESAFAAAVEQSFSAWTSVDPVSGLGTSLAFTPDFSTSVVGKSGFGGIDLAGAEIDLFGRDAGTTSKIGLTTFLASGDPVTLTSGSSSYTGSTAIAGVDLHINSNPGAVYTLDGFRRLLTHEIGHAIGLGDVDLNNVFIDDNYDPADPLGTLTNSWAGLVDPFDPASSMGLSLYSVPSSDFGITGVDILMESNGLGVEASNPLSSLVPLTNDDYGTRQYLYPSVTAVPEPSSAALLALVGLGWAEVRRRRGLSITDLLGRS